MITAEQVTALTAQSKADAQANVREIVGSSLDESGNLNVGWEYNADLEPVYTGTLLSDVGLGIYGQTPENLVLAGFLKPGTLNLITSPSMVSVVLNTPAVWTGQFGITSLLDYLSYPVIQNLTQISLLIGAYQGLLDAGILAGNESAKFQATFVQPAAKFGVDSVVSWVENTAGSVELSKIKISARQAQYAIDFVEVYGNSLNISPELVGVGNTTTRDIIDQTVTNIIGSEKIPALTFADAPIQVDIPAEIDEDGTFRFSPGNTQR